MQLVLEYHERITTTSLLVADKFEKDHLDVLEYIKNLECSPNFRELNFELSHYKSNQNKPLPMYFITRDGFAALVMSFKGAKAVAFREAFIDQFNKMENALRIKSTPTLLPTYQWRIMSEPTKSCPDSRWNIFDQAHEIMFLIEKHVGSVSQFDLVDGSIGSHWAKFRAGKPWAVQFSQYYHEYRDKRGPQLSKCYQYSELEHFKVWLKTTYKPYLLYDYLHSKYSREKNKAMLQRVENLSPKLISKPAA